MSDAFEGVAAGPRLHRPWLAAVLSFVFPGLGQAYAGRPRPALLLGLPVAVVVLLAIGVVTGVIGGVRNSLFASTFLVGVLIADLALMAWRGIAIADAGLVPWSRIHGHDRRTTMMVVASLLVVTLAMHAWVGIVVVQLNTTLGQVFAPNPGAGGPTTGGTGGGEPVNRPEYHWDGTDRINVLLLGSDAAPGRQAVLTDVILVVSVDPVSHTAEMISVPRDTGFVPLPDTSVYADGVFPEKINELNQRAALDPATWCPDLLTEAAACGIRTVERAIGLYLGIEINHYAIVDMAGFAGMIDSVGGVNLCLPGRLVDPEFDGSLQNQGPQEPLVLPAGCHQYDGIDALAYARSRKGWIEMPDGTRVAQNDFERSERQQKVLLALRRELAEADTILELPRLLQAIGRTVSSDFPRDRAGDLASLLPLVAGPDIDRVVLGYPDFVDLPTQPDVNYLLIPKREAVREEMARIFGADNLVGWYLGSEEPQPPLNGDSSSAEAPAP